METPAVIIKVKGLSAINTLSSQGQLLGGLKLKGLAAGGKTAAAKMGEIEAGRILATKKGLVLYAAEIEGAACAPKAVVTKAAAVTKAASVKGAGVAAVSGAATTKGAIGTGAALSAKTVGWSLGLGGFGPWLALGALGLAATGVYLYLRSQQVQDALEEPDEFGTPDVV